MRKGATTGQQLEKSTSDEASSYGPLIGHIRQAIAGAHPDDSVDTPVWLLKMVADALENAAHATVGKGDN
jgi:hypothetical protein